MRTALNWDVRLKKGKLYVQLSFSLKNEVIKPSRLPNHTFYAMSFWSGSAFSARYLRDISNERSPPEVTGSSSFPSGKGKISKILANFGF
jgi:hypothetical protein